jgi:hypothetical protein
LEISSSEDISLSKQAEQPGEIVVVLRIALFQFPKTE